MNKSKKKSNQDGPLKSWSKPGNSKELKFSKYWDEVRKVDVYRNLDQTIAYGICRDAYRQGHEDVKQRAKTFGDMLETILHFIRISFMLYVLYLMLDKVKNIADLPLGSSEKQEYLVENSTKGYGS